MDHSYGLARRSDASPAAIAVGARMVSFLHGGGRLVVLAGPSGPGASDILDLVLEGMPARILRVRNRLPGALDLSGILSQIRPGSEDDCTDGDETAALLRCLADRMHGPGTLAPAVLAIDDAHTLTPRALAALSRVPGLGGPDLPGAILLLAGEGALLDLLSARGLERMRDPGSALTIRLPGLARGNAAAVVGKPAIEPARGTVLGAITALIMAMVLLLRPSGTAPPAPLPQGAAPVASVSVQPAIPLPDRPRPPAAASVAERAAGLETLPAATLPAVALAAASPPPPVAELLDILHAVPSPASPLVPPSETPLRREFGAFLNRAGKDTALLTPEAREQLFREYLEWRARGASVRTTASMP